MLSKCAASFLFFICFRVAHSQLPLSRPSRPLRKLLDFKWDCKERFLPRILDHFCRGTSCIVAYRRRSVTSTFNLAQPFYENSVTNSQALALFVGEMRFSYGELANLARRISGWLGLKSGEVSGKVGILASRTLEAYAGVLGTLWSGAAYVPINPRTPEDRLIRILQQTKLDALIADQAGLDLLSDRVLECAPSRILFGAGAKPSQSALGFQGTSFESLAELADEGPDQPVTVAEDALAYIIFTSGTTGTPKGVMIETGSVAQFRGVVQDRFGFRPTDRVSQVAELTLRCLRAGLVCNLGGRRGALCGAGLSAHGSGEVHPRS